MNRYFNLFPRFYFLFAGTLSLVSLAIVYEEASAVMVLDRCLKALGSAASPFVPRQIQPPSDAIADAESELSTLSGYKVSFSEDLKQDRMFRIHFKENYDAVKALFLSEGFNARPGAKYASGRSIVFVGSLLSNDVEFSDVLKLNFQVDYLLQRLQSFELCLELTERTRKIVSIDVSDRAYASMLGSIDRLEPFLSSLASDRYRFIRHLNLSLRHTSFAIDRYTVRLNVSKSAEELKKDLIPIEGHMAFLHKLSVIEDTLSALSGYEVLLAYDLMPEILDLHHESLAYIFGLTNIQGKSFKKIIIGMSGDHEVIQGTLWLNIRQANTAAEFLATQAERSYLAMEEYESRKHAIAQKLSSTTESFVFPVARMGNVDQLNMALEAFSTLLGKDEVQAKLKQVGLVQIIFNEVGAHTYEPPSRVLRLNVLEADSAESAILALP